MTTIEDKWKTYQAKLDGIQKTNMMSHDQDLARVLRSFSNSPSDTKRQEALLLLNSRIEALQGTGFKAQVEFTGDGQLKALDDAFFKEFGVDKFFPGKTLRYRTVYCETLEEFFTPIVNLLKLPQPQKKALVREMCTEAEKNADQGGIYGANISGVGCYINGWLFSHPYGISPQQALKDPELLRQIMKTVVHEKLGHGFLDLYSALGKVESSLGAYTYRIAEQFGMHTADDPLTTIRQAQSEILLNSSWFLQEGWATWLESYFDANIIGNGQHPRHWVDALMLAILELPVDNKEGKILREKIAKSIEVVLTSQDFDASTVLQAVNLLHEVENLTDEHFSSRLGQPLRYVVGELIMTRIALNLGPRNVPFAALIAGNITMDPDKIALGDLRELLTDDPKLNPDARLVLLSGLTLTQKDNAYELAKLAENAIGIHVPPEIKKQS